MDDKILDVNTTPEESEAEVKEDLNAHNKISRYKKREQTFLTVFESLFSDYKYMWQRVSYFTKGWRINRISKISLAVLRVAVYEILYCEEIPVSVSINEAVELTKKYSITEDASFVNGLLGSLVKGKE